MMFKGLVFVFHDDTQCDFYEPNKKVQIKMIHVSVWNGTTALEFIIINMFSIPTVSKNQIFVLR